LSSYAEIERTQLSIDGREAHNPRSNISNFGLKSFLDKSRKSSGLGGDGEEGNMILIGMVSPLSRPDRPEYRNRDNSRTLIQLKPTGEADPNLRNQKRVKTNTPHSLSPILRLNRAGIKTKQGGSVMTSGNNKGFSSPEFLNKGSSGLKSPEKEFSIQAQAMEEIEKSEQEASYRFPRPLSLESEKIDPRYDIELTHRSKNRPLDLKKIKQLHKGIDKI
jgi:hypothetical protein